MRKHESSALGVWMIATALLFGGAAQATGFAEDFGSPPCNKALMSPDWFGKAGALMPFSGSVVTDPLDMSNCAMSFGAVTAGGDAFSSLIAANPGVLYVLEFDYLGDPTAGGTAGNLGGVIGISEGFPSGHRWFAGTIAAGGIESDSLIDDGTWNHYSIVFDPYAATGCCGYTGSGMFRVMLEDFQGVPRDAYFDNISVRVIDGACCLGAGPNTPLECRITTEEECDNAGGVYRGDLTECNDIEAECLPLEVTMDSMEAEVTKRGVLVHWTTLSEIDTVGFRVLRESQEKSLEVVSEMIPAVGRGIGSGSYEFLDDSKRAGSVYWIEDVDVFGRVTRHGPVVVERVSTTTIEVRERK